MLLFFPPRHWILSIFCSSHATWPSYLTGVVSHLSEAAGAGWARGAAEGPSALGAEGAAGAAGAAAERLREDAERQPGLGHVVGEVRLRQRWVTQTREGSQLMSSNSNILRFNSGTFKPSQFLSWWTFQQRICNNRNFIIKILFIFYLCLLIFSE